ncbi:adenine-specific DNA-methyltransferase [Alkalispirochaeta americana]|uniref:site-specific DNA-methyltransferase (adenine-specific) n=1 Tax=Alkalispirochaeta americana TaxID=159291 RepID=A0A1N6TJS0_9SPIO|nr:DNA adenine methylase [Alkalispirochaeta americana]SIQ53642.1 adenine-specific DNA-methyltransferase [Alkalispirochaeta americana]
MVSQPFLRDEPFLRDQVITCIGNKRALLPLIDQAVQEILCRLGRPSLAGADLFSGSGIVARYLKKVCHRLIANDLEHYSEVINRCYLTNRSDLDESLLNERYRELTSQLAADERRGLLREGFIARNYAPADDENIRAGERVFYTRRNACFLDTARYYIEGLEKELQPFFLGPLLAAASVHANTAGVFKGFYKDKRTGLGRFGGAGEDALTRIRGDIQLRYPCFSPWEGSWSVFREDANDLAPRLAQEDVLDLVYLDPPYNQHPYGSNYFMLNLIARYQEPREVSPVSGIPPDWNRSDYNSRRRVAGAFEELLRSLRTRFILVSFNSEGFLSREDILGVLQELGSVDLFETPYAVFRGSRNLRSRPGRVKEFLFLLDCRSSLPDCPSRGMVRGLNTKDLACGGGCG